MIDILFQNPVAFLFYALAMVVAITVHEFAHAYAADRLGDPTPASQGRLTLNPMSHLDPYGTLFLLLFGFGWGKPVQFDPFNLDNPRKDSAYISLAGPASNIIIAVASSLLYYLFIFVGNPLLVSLGAMILTPMIFLNILLAIFNLIPVHPLDGFKIVGGFLSEEKAQEWYQLERYGFYLLIFLIIPFGGQSMVGTIIGPIMEFLNGILIPSKGLINFI